MGDGMGYISDLRDFVGHEPLIMVGAGVIVQNQEGEILLQKRADNHLWGIPGGALEIGETLEEAGKRELFEETGLIANEMKLLNIFSGPELYNKYPNGDVVYNVATIYACRDYGGTLNLDPYETEEVRFFKLNELPGDAVVNPPDRVVFRWLAEIMDK